MVPPGARRWAYVRIMAGTILGGGLGFYVMHRIETSYKAKMEERLRRYEAHLLAKEKEAQELQDEGRREDQAQLLPDS
ncbi:uncharacterized protein LOC123407103 [Hordeum vulgare subsp. vulgare]|uniref:Uncharacterized protein n=1 Tax=Hordeum vulgare subsp. vulgare TaxID=112509 RepID=A0A8I6YQK7_HORVV|nr:uncharacterized protein LOC123407103 [Hordeum vulgare subsp. vulgare]KAI4971092.1 hypothetical protein ZWY2020_002006 [Hordeum vulgare]